jgi:NAD(P)-dependent dehydrogenase (short-subunit alcohol dehydrogenase family)
MTNLSELLSIKGRRVLITGANGNLGRVMAETLGELGADLILLDRPGTDFSTLENNLSEKWKVRILTLTYDIEVQEEREALIERVKSDGIGLNCLINNAAFVGSTNLQGWVAPFEEQSIETWRRAIEVNLTAAFHLSQAFAPELRAAKSGNIINIASIYGKFGPDLALYDGTEMGNPAAYAASKGGLLQLTRWLATVMAPDVRVNSISPGGIFRNQQESFVERYISKTPLKRMATEDDFRGAVAFLSTDMSSYVTGQSLSVDGGWGIW